ncbi:MAG: orotidine-5'-phosphate decarboxylase [Dehalococcoidales bacterium]|nr:orotidine-5'-phosphate decarboxylase [Dehalococcoidales bacterium]
MNFIEKLNLAVKKNKSMVCVGLDTSPELIPAGMTVFEFNKAIIDATADSVCAYKPNIAFYEAQGEKGLEALYKTVQHIPKDIPVIGDAKRGDIGNTSAAYARALFDYFNFDAVTVSPYLGFDSLEPFLKYKGKGVIILCRTSNKGAADFQSLLCQYEGKTLPLYEIVALKASRWNTNGNIGLVVGATYPEELKTIRQAHPNMPILIPGVGAQGGDLELAVRYGIDAHQKGIIINSSRGIIYASKGTDFADAARGAAETLRNEINKCIAGLKK